MTPLLLLCWRARWRCRLCTVYCTGREGCRPQLPLPPCLPCCAPSARRSCLREPVRARVRSTKNCDGGDVCRRLFNRSGILEGSLIPPAPHTSFHIAPSLRDIPPLPNYRNHHDLILLGAAASPSLMQLKDQLLEVIGEQLQQPSNLTFESEPLPRLAQRCAEMETSRTAMDPCPWLLEAHAELTQRLEAEERGGSSTGTVAAIRAYAALHEYCSTSLLLEVTALPIHASSSSHRPAARRQNWRTGAGRTLGVLHRFDLQFSYVLDSPPFAAAGARNEPDKGSVRRAEAPRSFRHQAVSSLGGGRGGRRGRGRRADEWDEAIEPPPLQQQGVESSTAATAQTAAPPPSSPIQCHAMGRTRCAARQLAQHRLRDAAAAAALRGGSPRTIGRLVAVFHEGELGPNADVAAPPTSGPLPGSDTSGAAAEGSSDGGMGGGGVNAANAANAANATNAANTNAATSSALVLVDDSAGAFEAVAAAAEEVSQRPSQQPAAAAAEEQTAEEAAGSERGSRHSGGGHPAPTAAGGARDAAGGCVHWQLVRPAAQCHAAAQQL